MRAAPSCADLGDARASRLTVRSWIGSSSLASCCSWSWVSGSAGGSLAGAGPHDAAPELGLLRAARPSAHGGVFRRRRGPGRRPSHAMTVGRRVSFECPLCLAGGHRVRLVAELQRADVGLVIIDLRGCPHADAFADPARQTLEADQQLIAAALDAAERRRA